MHNQVDLVVISGRSGSGKTVALHALEDLGFYCVDNLPVELLYNMIDLAKKSYPKIAISIDVRNLPNSGHEELLNDIYISVNNDPDIDSTIIFIDADDQVLIKRYSETRRLHPLSQKNLTLNEAIQKETEILKIISSVADLRIDTTNLSIHDLCKNVISCINGKPFKEVVIIFESFGYKDGITKAKRGKEWFYLFEDKGYNGATYISMKGNVSVVKWDSFIEDLYATVLKEKQIKIKI